MSGRFCSAACAVFFKRQAAAIEEDPKRRPSRIHITLRGKLVEHLADGLSGVVSTSPRMSSR
jgi:hypothetical protein